MFSCSGDDTMDEGLQDPIAILTLGGSRVAGNRPTYESYRYELWKKLLSAGYEVDFIGPFLDRAEYPPFMGLTFDHDHGGIPGNTSLDLLNRTDQALSASTTTPDVVLITVGGNDLLSGDVGVSDIISNIEAIVGKVQVSNSEAVIIIEQTTGPRSDAISNPNVNSVLTSLNEEIAALAIRTRTSTSQVVAVDMFTNFSDEYYADAVHFNEAGAEEVASRYFEIFQDLFAGN